MLKESSMPADIRCPKCASANVIFSKKRGKNVCEDCDHEWLRETRIAPLRIFLSYGHDTNAELVLQIKADLEKRGHDVWFDTSGIKDGGITPGDDWRRAITDGIVGSNCVLSFLSKHSTRDPGVCLDEIAIAIGVKGGNIQTVLVESETDVKPPPSISHIQWLDMHDWKQQRAAGEAAWNNWYQGKLAEIIRVVESEESRRFAGEIETLNGYLEPISSDARVAMLLQKGFVGRAWLFDAIEQWRTAADRGSRLFWITGDPGVGKSAFAAHLSHFGKHRVIAAQFVEWDKPAHRDALRVVRSLAFQLATRLPDYRKLLLTLPEITKLDRKNAAELFEYLVAAPLSSVIDGGRERFLIVVDALDEAGEAGRNSLVDMLAYNAPRLPNWIGLVVTSRPESAVNTPLQGLKPCVLATQTEANRADIRDYLRRELRPQLEGRSDAEQERLVAQILAKSEGVFLYVERFCNDVHNNHLSLDHPEQFPNGLGETFSQFFRRQFPDVDRFRKDVRPALRAILAARTPLPVETLRRLFNWHDEEIRDFTDSLGSLFPVSRIAVSKVIKPFHKSVADWLADDAKAGSYFVSPKEGHRLLADFGWEAYSKGRLAKDSYSLASLPHHLGFLVRCDAERSDDAREGETHRYRFFQVLGAARYYRERVSAFGPQEVVNVIQDLVRLHDCGLPGNDDCPEGPQSAWLMFFRRHAHKFLRRSQRVEPGTLLLQLASSEPETSLLGRAAAECISSDERRTPWLRPLPATSAASEPPVRAIFEHSAPVSIFGLDENETLLATAVHLSERRKRITVWSLLTGEALRFFDVDSPIDEHNSILGLIPLSATKIAMRASRFAGSGPLALANAVDGSIAPVCDGGGFREFSDLCHLDSGGVGGVISHPDKLEAWSMAATGASVLGTALVGHAGSAVLLPNGRAIVTATGGNWFSLGRGRTLFLDKGEDPIEAYRLRVWDLVTGNCLRELRGHRSIPQRISCSRDSKRLVSADHDNVVIFWDVDKGQPLWSHKFQRKDTQNAFGHTELAVSIHPTQPLIGVAHDSGSISLWDVVSDQCICELDVEHKTNGIRLGENVFAVGVDRAVRTYDIDGRRVSRPLKNVEDDSLPTDRDPWVATVANGDICCWSLKTGQKTRCFSYRAISDERRRRAAELSLIPAQALAANGEKTVRVVGNGQRLVSIRWNERVEQRRDGMMGPGQYNIWEHHLVTIWDLADCAEDTFWRSVTLPVAFSGDRSLYAGVLCVDQRHPYYERSRKTLGIGVLDSAAQKVKEVLFDDAVRCLCFHPSLAQVVSGDGQGLSVWDARTGELLRRQPGMTNVAFHPDGRRALSLGTDGTWKVWGFEAGSTLGVLVDPVIQESTEGDSAGTKRSSADRALFLTDGTFVARGQNGRISCWDVDSGACKAVLGTGEPLVLSPDEALLLTRAAVDVGEHGQGSVLAVWRIAPPCEIASWCSDVPVLEAWWTDNAIAVDCSGVLVRLVVEGVEIGRKRV
jgi:WD40 repeat protein